MENAIYIIFETVRPVCKARRTCDCTLFTTSASIANKFTCDMVANKSSQCKAAQCPPTHRILGELKLGGDADTTPGN